MDERPEAIILCGGRSRRLGRDKAFVTIGAGLSIERVLQSLAPVASRIRLAADSSERFTRFGLPVITDPVSYAGPLAALGGAFTAIATDLCYVAACDMPFLLPGYFKLLRLRLSGSDGCMARKDGLPVPLASLYRRSSGRAFRQAAEAGEKRLLPVLSRLDITYLDETELGGFPDRLLLNLNDEEALRQAREAVSGERSDR